MRYEIHPPIHSLFDLDAPRTVRARPASPEESPDFQSLHPDQQIKVSKVYKQLQGLAAAGLIDPKQVKKVCDFGAGFGGPTFAIRHFFKLPPQKVLALEKHSDARTYKEISFRKVGRVETGDGIQFLAKTDEKFDLITASMFSANASGSNLEGSEKLAHRLLDVSSRVLNPGGKLLVWSDVDTMAAFRKACNTHNGLPHLKCCHIVSGEPDMEHLPYPYTSLISFDDPSYIPNKEVMSYIIKPELLRSIYIKTRA